MIERNYMNSYSHRASKRSDFGVDLGDNVAELLEVDDSVAVLVGVLNHLVDLGGGEVLPDGCGHLLKLLGPEGSGAGGVEGLKDGLEGSLGGAVAEAEDVEEGAEVEVAGDAGGVDDVEDLGGLALDAEGLDGVDQLLDGDLSAAVVVEDVEDLLQLGDSVSVESLPHVLVGVESFL